jgi:serine/threonine protein kinase
LNIYWSYGNLVGPAALVQDSLTICLTRALRDFAEAGIVSGEVSPASVMLELDGTAKLSQFTAREPNAYTAPEQLLSMESAHDPTHAVRPSVAFYANRVTAACDVWGMAATLIRAWHPGVPLASLSVSELCEQYRYGRNPILAFLQESDMPGSIKAVLAQCLTLNPEERMTAVALHEQIRQSLSQTGQAHVREAIRRADTAAKVLILSCDVVIHACVLYMHIVLCTDHAYRSGASY